MPTTEEQLETLTTEMEDMKKGQAGVQTLLDGWKEEVGVIRTAIASLPDSEEQKALTESVKKVVDQVGTMQDTIDSSVKEPFDEGSLTETQRELALKGFESLPLEERTAIDADPEKRKQFFESLVEATPTDATPKLFRVEPPKDGSNPYRKLWEEAGVSKPIVAEAGKGAPTGLDGTNEPPEPTKKLVGGKIPRPKEAATAAS